jgi:Protein of unknown function (DUF2917)
MACFESATVIRLASREAITLPDIRGTTLRVTRGVIWLTQEHDRGDVVLSAGDTFVVESDGKTVVEAQDDATFAVIGRAGARLRLPSHARRASTLWPALVALFTPSAGYRAPYA